ncbi:MAG TPA: autotransporter-associated beta strand repeat-containing protein, partial [Acidimicrobiales bacterium]|nr:autotransporter-associated beta strand repeat-containing protein [Acidimicrobiales bacterium]
MTFPNVTITSATNNDISVDLSALQFDGSGYVIGGNPVNVGSGGITQTVAGQNAIGSIAVTQAIANLPVNIASGGVLTIGPVSGAFNLVKGGAGRLVLSGANTYTGNTQITGGSLIVNGNSAGSPHVLTAGALGGIGIV